MIIISSTWQSIPKAFFDNTTRYYSLIGVSLAIIIPSVITIFDYLGIVNHDRPGFESTEPLVFGCVISALILLSTAIFLAYYAERAKQFSYSFASSGINISKKERTFSLGYNEIKYIYLIKPILHTGSTIENYPWYHVVFSRKPFILVMFGNSDIRTAIKHGTLLSGRSGTKYSDHNLPEVGFTEYSISLPYLPKDHILTIIQEIKKYSGDDLFVEYRTTYP
jgi:hypothetical protein